MLNEVKVGIVNGADGSVNTARSGRTGATIVSMGHGTYAEPAMRGGIFEVTNGVAGVAPGTALSVAPPLSLWNPPSSGKMVCIFKLSMGYISGTLGAGSLIYGAVPAQTTVPTGGTELTPICTLIGFPRGVARGFTGSTLVAIPTPARAGFSFGAFVGTTASPPWTVADLMDSAICLPPGSVFTLQAVAGAGTSPLVMLAIAYEEIMI